jgi:hypothetical protein
MQILGVTAVALTVLLAPGAEGRELRKRELIPGQPNVEQLERKGSYQNRYGEEVQKPSGRIGGGIPDGATAQCRNGSYSFSHSRTGTCSRNGGVATWLR